MDLRKVKKLIELVEESAIEELEVASGDESIRIVMHRGSRVPSVVAALAAPAATAPAAPAATAPAAPAATAPAAGPALLAGDGTRTINTPMAGTFYRAPHPDAAPFVETGQSVDAGDVVCIVESMKMMHEIRAAEGGTIVQVCVENGQPINTGDALFTLS